jgi:hypothetical protein
MELVVKKMVELVVVLARFAHEAMKLHLDAISPELVNVVEKPSARGVDRDATQPQRSGTETASREAPGRP